MQHRLTAILSIIFFLIVGTPLNAQVPVVQQSDPAAESNQEPLGTLLDVLRNEEQRNTLINQLEKIQSSDGSVQVEPGTAVTDQQQPTVAREIANLTKSTVETSYQAIIRVWRDFSGITSIAQGISEQRKERIAENGPPLLATIATTIILLWLFTRLFTGFASRRITPNGSTLRNIVTVFVNALADVMVLVLAYAAGYLLAISVIGRGSIAVEQSLYLNAFLIAGVARIFLRVFVLPDRPEQAVFNFSAAIQRSIYTNFIIVGGILVYGVTAVVPIMNLWISFLVGNSISFLVVTLAAILALLAIRRVSHLINMEQLAKQPETEKLTDDASTVEIVEAASQETMHATLTAWHRIWPWLASLYVAFSYLIAIAQPRLMTDLIGAATLKTIIAAGAVALALRFVKRASTSGVPLPKIVRSTLPELKQRLDGFVPLVFWIASTLLIVVAAGFLIDAWQILDIGSWITSPVGTDIIWRVASALLILAIIILVWAVVASWIDGRLSLELEGRNVSARSRTLLALFRNAFTIALFIFGTMTALSQLGIDIAPLLAGAGVIGLAIGFGSQKLVQDIITGIFIQLDNAINEGDVITVGGLTGSVEKLTIRSVAFRDVNGTYHIVPFSSVDTVSNFMRKFAYHVAVIGVAYKENIPMVKEAMFEAFDRLAATDHGKSIIGELEMHGVVELAESSVNLRARIKTRPGKQWEIGREYTEIVKTVFDERGIEIPFPHRQMIYPHLEAGAA